MAFATSAIALYDKLNLLRPGGSVQLQGNGLLIWGASSSVGTADIVEYASMHHFNQASLLVLVAGERVSQRESHVTARGFWRRFERSFDHNMYNRRASLSSQFNQASFSPDFNRHSVG